MKKGRCTKGLSSEEIDALFFIPMGGSNTRGKDYCELCPVKKECLHYAVLYRERGIWGGTDDKERKFYWPFMIDRLMAEAIQNGTLENRDYEALLEPPQELLEVQDSLTEVDLLDLDNPLDSQLPYLSLDFDEDPHSESLLPTQDATVLPLTYSSPNQNLGFQLPA
jgi:hypothetical protein